MTAKRARSVACALGLGAVLAPGGIWGDELLVGFDHVGTVPKRGGSIESFEWVGDRIYSWDGHAFEIFDAADWSDIQLLGEVDVGGPVEYSMRDRILLVGSKAYLYVNDPVWILNPDNTTTGPSRYRTAIDLSDPTMPRLEGEVDFLSMRFTTVGDVAVGSFFLHGSTILELEDSGDLVERSSFGDYGFPSIVGSRVFIYNEGSIKVADITDVQQPVVTRMRAESPRDFSFSEPVFWDNYMAEGDYRDSELRIWNVADSETARRIATLALDATSVIPLAVDYPILYIENGKDGAPSVLAAIDISDPELPVVVGQSDLSAGVDEFRLVDSRAIVLSGGKLHLYEITRPQASELAYSEWQEENFGEETSLSVVGREADPDWDGISNEIEFALGTRPLRSDPSPLVLSLRDGQPIVSYNRRASVSEWFEYLMETSPTLVPGSWEVQKETRVSELFGKEFYEVEIPDGHGFARLRLVTR